MSMQDLIICLYNMLVRHEVLHRCGVNTDWSCNRISRIHLADVPAYDVIFNPAPLPPPPPPPWWGTMYAEIKTSCAENPELSEVLSFGALADQKIAWYVSPAARNSAFLISAFPSH